MFFVLGYKPFPLQGIHQQPWHNLLSRSFPAELQSSSGVLTFLTAVCPALPKAASPKRIPRGRVRLVCSAVLPSKDRTGCVCLGLARNPATYMSVSLFSPKFELQHRLAKGLVLNTPENRRTSCQQSLSSFCRSVFGLKNRPGNHLWTNYGRAQQRDKYFQMSPRLFLHLDGVRWQRNHTEHWDKIKTILCANYLYFGSLSV